MKKLNNDWNRHESNDGHDYLNRKIEKGHIVLKPTMTGSVPVLLLRTVLKVVDGRVYLDGGLKQMPIRFSGRLIIVDGLLADRVSGKSEA